MPRFSTDELRDVSEGGLGDISPKKPLFDPGFRASKRKRSESISVKQEDNDESTQFLNSLAKLKKKYRRYGYRANSIKSTTVFTSPRSSSPSSTNYVPSSNEPAPKKPKSTTKPTFLCCGCLDPFEFRKLTPLPCNTCLNPDKYCRFCLNAWFISTLSTKTFPTCCNAELISDDLFDVLPRSTQKKYTDVLEERANSSINVKSLFCASCDNFIRASQISDRFGSCPNCHSKTCLECRRMRSEHGGIHMLCPTFLEDPVFERLDPERFRRCPKCCVMIEKVSGCPSLRCSRCRCVFQFCCGERKCVCEKASQHGVEDGSADGMNDESNGGMHDRSRK